MRKSEKIRTEFQDLNHTFLIKIGKKMLFPVEQKHWNIFERNNKDITLNIFSAHPTEKEINIIRRSKRKRKCEK